MSKNSGINERLGEVEEYDGSHFFIEFISLTEVPKADLFSESDPFIQAYIALKVAENEFTNISGTVETPFKVDNKNPVFHSIHDFFVVPPDDAYLIVKIFDLDFLDEDDLLIVKEIPIASLRDGEEHTYNLGVPSHPKCSITLRQILKTPPSTRTFFIIRHGESKWNEAQASSDITGMLGQNDHGLTHLGVTQAQRLRLSWQHEMHKHDQTQAAHIAKQLRTAKMACRKLSLDTPGDIDLEDTRLPLPRSKSFKKNTGLQAALKQFQSCETFSLEEKAKEYHQKFFQADKIYSSPLTRAVQTALVAMSDHPALQQEGLTLYSVIREVKGPGGMDTVGVHTGSLIAKHVRSEFATLVSPRDADAFMSADIHINDANEPWWTPQTMMDNKEDIQNRVEDWLKFTRFSDENVPVFVGHSLFWKAFYKRRISEILETNRPELVKKMQKKKMGNAAIMAVTVAYLDEPVVEKGILKSKSIILDAHMLFNTNFHGDEESEQDSVDVGDIDINL